MLPGKYVDVITDFRDPLELTGKIREGYLKVAWKSESRITIGYLLIKKNKIVGSLVESVPGDIEVEGDDAFREILHAAKKGLIKAVELYEADIEDILKAYPKIRVTLDTNVPSSGKDLDSFLSLLGTYTGGVEIQNGSKAWLIHVDRGFVTAAKAVRGSSHRGTDAVKEILLETGHLLKDGKYITREHLEFSSEDRVYNGKILREGLELVREKRRFEKGF